MENRSFLNIHFMRLILESYILSRCGYLKTWDLFWHDTHKAHIWAFEIWEFSELSWIIRYFRYKRPRYMCLTGALKQWKFFETITWYPRLLWEKNGKHPSGTDIRSNMWKIPYISEISNNWWPDICAFWVISHIEKSRWDNRNGIRIIIYKNENIIIECQIILVAKN